MIIRVSSAYCIIGKSEVKSRGMGTCRKFMSLALLMSVCKKSAARTKSRHLFCSGRFCQEPHKEAQLKFPR
jgi:hypothetical protein